MNNLTIKQKLIALASFVVVALIFVGGFSLYKMYRANVELEDIANNWLPSVKAIGEIHYDFADYRLKDAAVILMDDDQGRAEVSKQRADSASNLEKALQTYGKLVCDEEDRKLYEQLVSNIRAYQKYSDKLHEIARENDDASATSFYRGDMLKQYYATAEILQKMVTFNEKGSDTSKEEAEAGYQQTIWVMSLVILVSCALASLISWFVIISVTRGVDELTRVFTLMASLDLRARSQSQSADEIGKILKQFNTTVDTLTTVVSGTQEAATSVAAASHELSSGMSNIATIVQQQEGSLTSIAAALEETSQSSQEVNSKAQRSGKTTLEVVSDIRKVVEKVAELRTKADNISDVLNIIRSVSEQINLLSLNATIEAARAGESGRGFAVVADEVKKLAGHTHKSTDDISRVVEDLQKSVGETNDALQSVSGSLEEVRGNSDSVVSAVGQQTIAVKNITETIDEFRHQMSLVTNNVKEAQTAALSLSAAAEELNRQNSQFKV